MTPKAVCFCECCGKEYRVQASKVANSRFCSKECKASQYTIFPGSRFGRLTVLHLDLVASHTKRENGRLSSMYLCECDCGTVKSIARSSLVSGSVRSCGCYQKEYLPKHARKYFTKHGRFRDPAYRRWLRRHRNQDGRSWAFEMDRLLFEIQPACVICGSTSNLQVDHVFPFIKGGLRVPGNVVVLCRKCNSTKSDNELTEMPAEWREKIDSAAAAFAKAWEDRIVNE